MTSTADRSEAVIYLMRKDLRLEDNPIFHFLANNPGHNFKYLLPVYVFPADQIAVSGFIAEGSNDECPYPEARSKVGKYWKCGPHRVKFLAETVWELKETLRSVNSDLEIRVGGVGETLESILKGFDGDDVHDATSAAVGTATNDQKVVVTAVWMTDDEGPEERQQEKDVKAVCDKYGIYFELWKDEKYLIDDDDVKKLFETPDALPDIFTTYRKMVEPLRENTRDCLATPKHLPPLPSAEYTGRQVAPFVIPNDYAKLEEALLYPLTHESILSDAPPRPKKMISAHPFHGGTNKAHERIHTLLCNGAMSKYHDTRNGLLGLDFSTKLSAYLALGCLTARTLHAKMFDFEEGNSTDPKLMAAPGFGKGQNEGTKSVRFELAWRDYMRLCTRKFPDRLFSIGGFKADFTYPWNKPDEDDVAREKLSRFLNGTTGIGLIDASMRELYHTGYTSNRARQNVASFLAKHLDIDWRYGAEWYESMLVDYDANSNWGNWQYVSGVGNDPRGDRGRVFNPIKQAHDYDGKGEYIYHWIPEFHQDKYGMPTALVSMEKTPNKIARGPECPVDLTPNDVFRGYLIRGDKLAKLGIKELPWIQDPIMRVQFFPNHKNHINRGKDTRGFLTRRGLVPPGKGGNDGGDKGGRSGSGSASPTKASGASSGRGNSAPQQQKNGGNKTQQGSPANTPKGSKESSPHRQASKDYVQHVLPLEIDVRGGRAPPINSRRAQQPQRGGWNYQPPFGNNQAHNANTHSLPYRPTNGNKTTRYSSSNNNNNTYQRHSADFGRRSSANNANTAYQMPLHPNPPPGLTIHPNPLQQQWPMPMPLPPGMGMGVSMPNHHQHPPQQYTQQNMMMGWGMDGMGMGMGIQSTQAQAQAQQLMAQTPVPVPTLSPHQHRWGNGALERMAWEQPLPPPRLVGGSGDARNHLGAGGMASPPQPQPMPWGGQTGQVAQGQVVNGGGGGAMSANWRQMM